MHFCAVKADVQSALSKPKSMRPSGFWNGENPSKKESGCDRGSNPRPGVSFSCLPLRKKKNLNRCRGKLDAMVFLRERKINGEVYLYIEKTVRIGKRIIKVAGYLGKKEQVTKTEIDTRIREFTLTIDEKTREALKKNSRKQYDKLEYPLTVEETLKMEEMNLKYKEIKKSVRKEDWKDVTKRFIANFVFESNALEGNS